MTRTTLPFLLSVLFITGCRCTEATAPADPPEAEHHDEKEGHDELPRQLKVEPSVLAASGIVTAPAVRARLATTISLPGEVTAEPDRTARLSAAAAGRLEQVQFNEGAAVKKGDVMATLRVPDVGRLRGGLSAASARAKASRANAARLRALKESGLGSEQAVLDAEADASAQEAEARALTEQLGAMGAGADGTGQLLALRAPISGVVVARDAVVGQPISADHVLATIVDLSEVWFLGRVFEKDLSRLQTGASASVQLNAFPTEHFAGVVEFVGQQTDPVARTLTARVRLKNDPPKLRLGLFGSAHVEVAEANETTPQVVVPRSAVTEIGGKQVVFVKAPDGDFVLHEVRLGDAALDRVQVLAGLDEKEEVATSGVFTLKSLLLKSTLAEDE